MKLFVGVIIVAIIVFVLFLAGSLFGGITNGVTNQVGIEKQFRDGLQEKINYCRTLSNDGTLQSPGVLCGIEVIPELIAFCERYPNSVLDDSSCIDVLTSVDELKRLQLALNP
jgi:hypothetical protein